MFTQKKITVKLKDLAENYYDHSNSYGGVVGLNGRLNIRPNYQREFVYKDKQRDAVIDSILGSYDISKFTWGENDNGTYEVIDGQQRTISICQFVSGEYSVRYNGKDIYYHTMTAEQKEKFDNYEIDVVVCIGTQDEKLEWFKRVNIAGEKLTEQELRNAAYPSAWLEEVKRYFSKPNGVAQKKYSRYLKGNPIRQDYLETVLEWYAHRNKMTIEEVMAYNITSSNANDLIKYIENVFDWVEMLFQSYHKEMLGMNWGILYNIYARNYYSDADKVAINETVEHFFLDEDVTNYKGIYEYVLSNCDENMVKVLNIRAFDLPTRRLAFARQDGKCRECGKAIVFEEAEAHHIKKWSLGGKTTAENCGMVCRECHKKKLH